MTTALLQLTPGEKHLVQLLADGLTLAAAADQLGIAPGTAASRSATARDKAGVSGVGGLVHEAYVSGAIDPPQAAADSDDAPVCLPDEQSAVLVLMAKGMDAKVMSTELRRPVALVRRDARAVMAAIGAVNPAHAITRAWQLGLLGTRA
ncbi:helix-turn-helix transcriptional regulator [Streptomyces sp. NPDC001142]